MPRVNHVKRARKDATKGFHTLNGIRVCGKCRIELPKGAAYRWWKGMRGGPRGIRCMETKCRPRPTDLSNAKTAQIYEAQEDLSYGDSVDSVTSAVHDFAEIVREVGQEYQESADNIPQGLNKEELEEWASELDDWADELESWEPEISGSDGDEVGAAFEQAQEQAEEITSNCPI